MNKERGNSTAAFIFCVLLVVGGAWGWVWNVVKIVGSDFDHITGLLVVRIIGIFIAPLGAILGFF